MKTFLFVDTETTGFKKNGNLIQDGQARCCQIGILLTNEEGKSIAEFKSLIKPHGWNIHEGAQRVHGITDADCARYGLDFRQVFLIFKNLAERADVVIAHNADFDKGIMEVEEAYYNLGELTSKLEKIWFCTMKTNTHIKGGKWPKLTETLEHYCGRKSGKDAHDAMADVRDCRDIFFAMQKQNAA